MSKHNTMSENNSDPSNDSTERWKHTGTGSGRADGELFAAMFEDRDAKAQIYPVSDGEVHFGVVVGQDDADGATFSADMTLTPEKAEALGRDLIDVAAGARDE